MRPDHDRSEGPERIFRALRDRETPELDSEAAWRRLRASLPDREPAPLWGLGWRAAAAAAVVLVALGLVTWQAWLAPGLAGVPAGSPVAGDADTAATPPAPVAAETDDGGVDQSLVLLAGARAPEQEATAAGSAAARAGALLLDVRLLRAGVDDEPALGAGGADATADIDATLRVVLPDRDYGLVGRWQGDLGEGVMETDLAPGYRLAFEVDRDDPQTLRRVRLIGERGPLVADEIRLDTDQVYLFGVRDAAGGSDDVLLAIRLRAAAPAARER